LCHLLTRYQSTIFPNHKSCVRKKGVPSRHTSFFLCTKPRLSQAGRLETEFKTR